MKALAGFAYAMKWKKAMCKRVLSCFLLFSLMLSNASTIYATEPPEDNSPYDLPENNTDNTTGNTTTEDMTGKVLIAVRKPTDFRVYSKKVGVFVVEAKNKGEITGYDIRVRKSGSNNVKNYRAMTKQNLKRRFIGGKQDAHYMIKVRTFRTINGKDYPSKWTKEKQVIILKRNEDDTPSNTRLNDKKEKSSGSSKKSKKK